MILEASRKYGLLLFLMFTFCTLHAKSIHDNTKSLGVIVRPPFRGELEFANRIQLAAKNLNCDAKIVTCSSPQNCNDEFDWLITLVPVMMSDPKDNQYLVLFDPVHHFFDNKGFLRQEYRRYRGYLTTYEDTETLKADVGESLICPTRWYPTVQSRSYRIVRPNQLFFFIGQWGERGFSKKYLTMQRLLSKKAYAKFYGNESFGKKYGSAFKGPINFNGETVLDLISECGVCLVLHSQVHIAHHIPSCRIFEAAASSAVIICDLNPFVMDHFGDSVLYIDQTRSGTEIFAQIEAHMNWIQEHPDEALLMAKKAHEIYKSCFLLEDQLQELFQFFRSQI